MRKECGGGEGRAGPIAFSMYCLFVLTPCAFSADYSGGYRCDFAGDMNVTWYVVIEQSGNTGTAVLGGSCAFPLSVEGNRVTVVLDGPGQMVLDFTPDGQTCSGTWQYGEESGTVTGVSVPYDEWSPYFYDIDQNGVPRFVERDFTELHKISEVSRLRSSAGHDYSDCVESCRSMKHYYYAFPSYRENQNLRVFSPVEGVVESIRDERHGSSEGLTNKQVWIQAVSHPAFMFILFHIALTSSDLGVGTPVQAGQLLGHAHLYYPDLDETAPGFDIAVQVSTPSGQRYVSYGDTMTDALFSQYSARGVSSRTDLIIDQAARDADPLTCDGETFLTYGTIDNWVILGPPPPLYTVAGLVYTDANSPSTSGVGDVTVTIGGVAGTYATTSEAAQGLWQIDEVPHGSYMVTPSKAGYTFQHVSGGTPDGQSAITIDVNEANQAANQSIQFLAEALPAELHDWNGDGIVSIVGDVPPFVQCVYFGNCPGGVDTIAVGDCNGDGFLSLIGDVPCFVDCVYFGSCP